MEDKKHNLITNRTSGGGVSTLEFYSKQKSKTHRAVIALIFIIVAVIFLLQFETFNTTKITELSVGEQLSVKKSNPNSKSEKSIKASAGIFVPSCPKLQQIQDTISSTKKRIWKDWDVSNYPLFLSIIQIPETSWNIQKAKFVKLLLSQEMLSGQDGEVNSLENQLKSQSFVVGFSGSSVTAGHDNFFFEAYPNVFYETMLPVFNTLGNIELVVRNHALGNNPCYPYDACMETHMGDDLDILTWEQSMNCGRQPNQIDTFARSAYRMPKKPTILFLESVNPHWSDKECDKLNITSATPRLPLTANEQAILTTDIKTLATRKNMVMSNMKYLNDEQARESLANRFARLAPMGQDLNAMGVYKCYGPYTAQFSAKTLGGGGGWHPGKLTHQYRGDNLAFFMLSILEDAVSSIQQGRECSGAASVGLSGNSGAANSGAGDKNNSTVTNIGNNKNKRMLRSVNSGNSNSEQHKQQQQQRKQKQQNRELKGKLSKITGTSAGTVTTSSSIIDPTASSDRISAFKKSEHKAEIHTEHNEHSSEHHAKQPVVTTNSPTATTVTTPVITGAKSTEPVPSSNKINNNNNNNNNNNKNDNKIIENNSIVKQVASSNSSTIAHSNGHLSKVSGISANTVTVTSGNKIVHSSHHHIDANGNENTNRTEQSVPKPVNTGKLSVLTGTSAGSVSVTSGNKLLNTTALHSNIVSNNNIHKSNTSVVVSSGSVSSSTTKPEHQQEMTHNHGKLSHISGTSAATVTTGATLTEPLQHAPTNNDHHNEHSHSSNNGNTAITANNVHNSNNNHANSEVKPATPQVTTATPASSVTQAQATPATVHHHQATAQSKGKLTVSGTSAGTVTTGSSLLNPKRQLSDNNNDNNSDNNSTNKNINNDRNSSISISGNNKRKSALDLIENRTYSTATGYIDNALDNNIKNSAGSGVKLDPNMIRHSNAVAQARTQMKKNAETLKQHENKLISTANNMTNLVNKSKQSLLLLNAQKQQENSVKNKPTSAENILKYPVSVPKTRFLSEESPVLSVDNEETSFVSSIFQFFSSIFGGSSDVKRLNALEQIKYFKKLSENKNGDKNNRNSNNDNSNNMNTESLDKLIHQTINDTTLLNQFVTAFKTGKYNTVTEKNTLVSLIQLEYSNYYLKEAQKVPLPPVPVHYKTNEINTPQSCFTNFEPRIGNSLTSQVINKHTNWNLSLSFFDINGVAHSILKQFNYIDRKYIFVSTGIHSQIALHIHTKSENPVWICENQKGMMKYPDYMGDLNVAADAYIMLNYKQYETNSNNNVNNINSNNSNSNNNNSNNINNNSNNRSGGIKKNNSTKHSKNHRRLNEQHKTNNNNNDHNNNNKNRKLQSAMDIINGVQSDTPTTITAITTAAEKATTKPSQSASATAAATTAVATPTATSATTTTAATAAASDANEDPKLAKSRLFVGDTGSMRAIDIINGQIGTPTVQATVRPRAVRTSRSNYTRNSIKSNTSTSSTSYTSHKINKDTKTKLPLKTTATAVTATSHERIAFRKKTDSTDNVQPHSASTTTSSNKAAVSASTPVDKFTTIAIEKFSHPKRLPLVPPPVISYTDADSRTKTIELSAPIEFNSEVFVPLDLSDTTKFQKLEINEFQSQCYRTSIVPPGEHMLVLVQKDRQQQVNIGYLITW